MIFSRFPVRKVAALALALCLLLNTVYAVFAVGGKLSAQLACFLLLPGALYLIADALHCRRLAAVILGLATLLSAADTGLRGFVTKVYRSDISADFIIESIANTHLQESLEYGAQLQPDILFWGLLTAGVWLIELMSLIATARSRSDEGISFTRLTVLFLVFALAGGSFTLLNRAWRHKYPGFGWYRTWQAVLDTRASWAQAAAHRVLELDAAKAALVSADPSPRTIVLVIGESTNRDNMSLYGYERDTTPQLREMAGDTGFRYFGNAWSTQASTALAFGDMFDFRPTPEIPERGNLFSAFRAAGWHITWLSNQDDRAIRSQFAEMADSLVVLNRVSGRSSSSPDDEVIEPLKTALADPHQRKLIVVHLLGLHPHFALRFPKDLEPGWSDDDSVEKHLEELHRSPIVQQEREYYDLGILHQDAVLSETLKLTQKNALKPAFWFYLSDHGVETGEYDNRTGHNPALPSGYRIPAMLWTNDSRLSLPAQAKTGTLGFRSDWVSDLLLDAAGIRLKFSDRTRSALSPDYRWQPPESAKRFDNGKQK